MSVKETMDALDVSGKHGALVWLGLLLTLAGFVVPPLWKKLGMTPDQADAIQSMLFWAFCFCIALGQMAWRRQRCKDSREMQIVTRKMRARAKALAAEREKMAIVDAVVEGATNRLANVFSGRLGDVELHRKTIQELQQKNAQLAWVMPPIPLLKQAIDLAKSHPQTSPDDINLQALENWAKERFGPDFTSIKWPESLR